MAELLKDFRGKITIETDCALEAEARSTGRDKAEIVRDVLSAWANQKIHAARLLDRLLKAEGEPGIVEGSSGRMRE